MNRLKIGVFLNTPAQVHFYKNIIRSLSDNGNEVYTLARDYGETLQLLDELGINHYVYARPKVSKYGKIVSLPKDVLCAYNYLKSYHVDLITGFGVYDAFTSTLLHSKCVEFADSEPRVNRISYAIQFKLFMPFVDVIITPDSFMDDLGKKQITVNSFKELAYLHPNYYKPEESIKEILGLEDREEYALLRFNAFDAVHDLGVAGFTKSEKIRLVHELEKYVKVFISSEGGVPNEIANRVLKIPKSRIHDVIFYARIMVADTGTMITEAACLGTPAIIMHPGVKKLGNFVELENKYKLIYGYDRGSDQVMEKAIELVTNPNIKSEWKSKREKLLKDKIDITVFMLWFIENYQDSITFRRNTNNK